MWLMCERYHTVVHCVFTDISDAEKMGRFERGLKPDLQQKGGGSSSPAHNI
jgi:hypothetical protein